MSFRLTTMITAGLFGALLIAGSVLPVHAGDGCKKDKKEMTTDSLGAPTLRPGQGAS
jgi:hypothetical protein